MQTLKACWGSLVSHVGMFDVADGASSVCWSFDVGVGVLKALGYGYAWGLCLSCWGCCSVSFLVGLNATDSAIAACLMPCSCLMKWWWSISWGLGLNSTGGAPAGGSPAGGSPGPDLTEVGP